MNLPNKITITRLLIVPLFILVYLLPYESMGIYVPTFTILFTKISLVDLVLFFLFTVASLTDYFDGYLARKRHLVTTFGKFIDPIADKLIVNSAILLLANEGRISIIVALVMISRDTIVDAIRFIAASRNEVIAASIFGKAKTMTQMVAICLVLLNNPLFEGLGIPFDMIMIWIATAISAFSGIDYFMKSKNYIMESM